MKTIATQAANRRAANAIGRVHSLQKSRTWLENPKRRAERAQRRREFEQSLRETHDSGHTNVMEVIFRVMKDSIADTAKDRELQLEQLRTFNRMSEQLSEYLDELVKRFDELGKEATKTSEESGAKSTNGTTCSASSAMLKARQLERLAAQAERATRHGESEAWEDFNIAEITALLRHAREMFAIAAQTLSRTAARDVKQQSSR